MQEPRPRVIVAYVGVLGFVGALALMTAILAVFYTLPFITYHGMADFLDRSRQAYAWLALACVAGPAVLFWFGRMMWDVVRYDGAAIFVEHGMLIFSGSGRRMPVTKIRHVSLKNGMLTVDLTDGKTHTTGLLPLLGTPTEIRDNLVAALHAGGAAALEPAAETAAVEP